VGFERFVRFERFGRFVRFERFLMFNEFKRFNGFKRLEVFFNFGLLNLFVFSGTLRILKCSSSLHLSGEGLGKGANVSIKHPIKINTG